MKKIIAAVLAFALFFCLSGCGQTPASLDKEQNIPSGGVISAETLKKIKSENKIAVFSGRSGGLIYKWTLFASDIPESLKDINLAVELAPSSGRIELRFLSDKDFGFSPELSIENNELWQAESASVQYQSGEYSRAELAGGGKIINFAPKTQKGEVTITPQKQEDIESTAPSRPADGADISSSPSPTARDDISSREEKSENISSNIKSSGEKVSSQIAESVSSYEKSGDILPEKKYYCTISIECSSVFNHIGNFSPEKLSILPADGVILPARRVEFYEGESVFDILSRECRQNGVHLESSFTPLYGSVYVEGIGNLYEFDCGALSGWMYRVDGHYPNYGCSKYIPQDGAVIEWRYTCDLGNDIGGANALGD